MQESEENKLKLNSDNCFDYERELIQRVENFRFKLTADINNTDCL